MPITLYADSRIS